MEIAERKCIRSETFVDGDKSITLEAGKTYTTEKHRAGPGGVFVFSRYWFWAPAECFGLEGAECALGAIEGVDGIRRAPDQQEGDPS